ncbi:hypothetical protein RRG08_020806 [Elysia crispata]|uniref:Uncharacterized protein n=1 Tax=Elysia crispata TaxID=231223 RepID=A0AAE0YR57_9GAST|nr:hypothetical protein RRG08_020806 [Elysia crispata]
MGQLGLTGLPAPSSAGEATHTASAPDVWARPIRHTRAQADLRKLLSQTAPGNMATLKLGGIGLNQLMLIFALSLDQFVTRAVASSSSSDRCPADYRYRVETCVMEAQVAPQAGGGLPLITERNKLEELCSRGILQKTIECLRDIHARCAGNATRQQELDMLFSVEEWRRGRALLCEDLNRKLGKGSLSLRLCTSCACKCVAFNDLTALASRQFLRGFTVTFRAHA